MQVVEEDSILPRVQHLLRTRRCRGARQRVVQQELWRSWLFYVLGLLAPTSLEMYWRGTAIHMSSMPKKDSRKVHWSGWQCNHCLHCYVCGSLWNGLCEYFDDQLWYSPLVQASEIRCDSVDVSFFELLTSYCYTKINHVRLRQFIWIIIPVPYCFCTNASHILVCSYN